MATTSPTVQKRASKPTARHGARLDFRLPDEAKARIEKAALVSGQSLSDFAASTLVKSANEVLAAYEATTLSDRDRDLFLQLLDADDEPNEALTTAFTRYQEGNVESNRYLLPGENSQANSSSCQ